MSSSSSSSSSPSSPMQSPLASIPVPHSPPMSPSGRVIQSPNLLQRDLWDYGAKRERSDTASSINSIFASIYAKQPVPTSVDAFGTSVADQLQSRRQEYLLQVQNAIVYRNMLHQSPPPKESDKQRERTNSQLDSDYKWWEKL